MNIRRASASVRLKNAEKAAFLDAIKGEYNGASDFFRRCILENCAVAKEKTVATEVGGGFSSLNVSIEPEQRAALLAQCEKEGVTMGTWMRRQILEYLAAKK